jgi:hypothetical protein
LVASESAVRVDAFLPAPFLNPENPGGHVTVVAGRDEDYLAVQRSLARWEGPRQTRKEFKGRIAEISSRVEPLNVKFPEVLAQYSGAGPDHQKAIMERIFIIFPLL